MKQVDNLDFVNASIVLNHPAPTNDGDGANKDYCDPILSLFYSEYVLPLGSSLNVATTTASLMIGFSLLGSATRNDILYKLSLNLRLTTAIAARAATIIILRDSDNLPILTRTIFMALTTHIYSFDFETWVTMASGDGVKVYWSSSVAGSTITNSSANNQLSSLSIMGFPNSLFSLT